jgi:hypothetical protein
MRNIFDASGSFIGSNQKAKFGQIVNQENESQKIIKF